MLDLLDSLRSALQHELAVSGPLVPMPAAPTRAQPPPRTFPERMDALLPAGSPLAHMATLGEIAAWVERTPLIDIDRTRTRAVAGHGKADADLVVIGEAPGLDEDRTGKPFVGRAGLLLTKILAAIHIDREDIFITNILKSRPPSNRRPEQHEMSAHLPILYRQLALIRPCLLLALGKTAGTGLLGLKTSLSGMRGRFHDFHGLPCMVTYHPAALLRHPNWKKPTWEDVQRLRNRYDELTECPTATHV